MFLRHLEPSEKRGFLGLAKTIISSDGDVSPEENKLLQYFVDELGISADEQAALTPQQAAPLFSDRRSRICVLLELVALSYADGVYHNAESSLIRDISHVFGISQIDVELINGWVRRQAVMLREADLLIGSEN